MLQSVMTTSLMPAGSDRSSADEDRRLAGACAAGDTKVFEELYGRFGARMKSLAWNTLGNVSDAEDAVQETFLKIHRAATTYTGEASFATWAFRILVNTCYDLLRKRKRRIDEAPLEDLVETGGRVVTGVDDTKRMTLRKLLHELPEQRRTVFTLFEIEGLSHAEIAGILGISEGNSKWILFATKKELREKWLSVGGCRLAVDAAHLEKTKTPPQATANRQPPTDNPR